MMQDKKLIERLEKLYAETLDLLVSIREGKYQDNCNCGRFEGWGTCEYHSYTHNLLRDYKIQLQAELCRLYDGQRGEAGNAHQNDSLPAANGEGGSRE